VISTRQCNSSGEDLGRRLVVEREAGARVELPRATLVAGLLALTFVAAAATAQSHVRADSSTRTRRYRHDLA
jgi:hypothetical protein